MKLFVGFMLLFIFITACAPTIKWTKANYNQAVFDYDFGNCKTEAETVVPPAKPASNQSRMFAGFSTPEDEKREAALEDYISTCMQRKGYYLSSR
jgi:hypothetical protein